MDALTYMGCMDSPGWLLKGLSHLRKTAVIPCQPIAGDPKPLPKNWISLPIMLGVCFIEFAA